MSLEAAAAAETGILGHFTAATFAVGLVAHFAVEAAVVSTTGISPTSVGLNMLGLDH